MRIPCFVTHRIALFLAVVLSSSLAFPASDPLPSWNDGPSKTRILEFVRATTEQGSPQFIPTEERIATFDQDGTLWVEHPIYTQVMFVFDQVAELAPKHPEWKTQAPYRSVLASDKAAMAKFSKHDIEMLVAATSTGMNVEDFTRSVRAWMAKAKHPRLNRHYSELTYLPMQELLAYLRANGFTTFIVTGGGQDFVRAYSQEVYGIPPHQVVGTAGATDFRYDAEGKALLIKTPKLELNDNFSGKPEGIHLMVGRRPNAAGGNSSGDQQMLEYTEGGAGPRLMLLVAHDDGQREFSYGPAGGRPATKVGAFPESLAAEAQQRGWLVVSMKNDWKKIFSWESETEGTGGSPRP